MKLSLFSLLAAILLAIPLAADTVVEEIVARVNSDIITRSEFQRSRDQLLNELKQKFGAEADARFAENEKNVLRDLIDQDLLVQKGKDLGLNGDTEVIKRLDQIRKQVDLERMECWTRYTKAPASRKPPRNRRKALPQRRAATWATSSAACCPRNWKA